jgi:nucleoside phosphorylase
MPQAIGSSDRSLRNVELRDRLAREHDLIAFEMEGKGFGGEAERSDLSWLVVRGISD